MTTSGREAPDAMLAVYQCMRLAQILSLSAEKGLILRLD